MTTQRNRLAAVLHEVMLVRSAVAGTGGVMTVEQQADALLARGVRVVDVETLAAALTKGAEYVDAGTHGRPPRTSHQLWLSGALASVADVIAALDADE